MKLWAKIKNEGLLQTSVRHNLPAPHYLHQSRVAYVFFFPSVSGFIPGEPLILNANLVVLMQAIWVRKLAAYLKFKVELPIAVLQNSKTLESISLEYE